MVGNPRSELASSITEGSSLTAAFCNGQRGSYSGASLERSGSFRESIDSRVLSSGVGGNKTISPVTSAETPSPSQVLILDFLSLGDQKYPRAGELRRVIGVSLEDHSFGVVQSKPLTPAAAEELKRFKASVSETTSKARSIPFGPVAFLSPLMPICTRILNYFSIIDVQEIIVPFCSTHSCPT